MTWQRLLKLNSDVAETVLSSYSILLPQSQVQQGPAEGSSKQELKSLLDLVKDEDIQTALQECADNDGDIVMLLRIFINSKLISTKEGIDTLLFGVYMPPT